MNSFFQRNATTIFALIGLLSGGHALSQAPGNGLIPDEEARQHLLPHIDPFYPPIARAAHVEGTVLLQVDVNATGTVTHVNAIAGPDMLRGAALDTVKGWIFRPFEVDGKPAAVKIALSVPFALSQTSKLETAQHEIFQTYRAQAERCASDFDRGHYAAAEASCNKTLQIALRFPDPSQASDLLEGAHEAYGKSLLYDGKREDALKEFQQAVEIADKFMTETYQANLYASAYNLRALAEQSLGQTDAAEHDYSTAEKSYRAAIDFWKGRIPERKAQFSQDLARCLFSHSRLVLAMGDANRANAMSAEARQLDPHIDKAFKQKD